MGNPTTPEKEIQRSKADRETRMLIFPTEATHPTEESTEHQKGTADHAHRYRRSDRASPSFALNYAQRSQRHPKGRPNQKTQNGQDDKDRQQHAGHESHNERAGADESGAAVSGARDGQHA